jgi:tRNA-specific 2-thiouridylase
VTRAPVLVALSGGVDSSVAAALLVDAGHDVVGVTMKLWGGTSDTGCCSVSDVDDARRVAHRLGIEHHVFNFGDEFERDVVAPYAADHAAGRTPNPCIECNRKLKFDKLLRRAEALGFELVATGHHARRVGDGQGRWRVGRGADGAKDQSYVLHTLGQAELAMTLFPVGELTKAQVRDRAAGLGLPTAAKPDSQDVCFITRADGRRRFLDQRIDLHAAPVVDCHGVTVGRTDAVELVTIGQRKGLDLAGGAGRRFVVDVDVAGRRVVVGDEHDLLRDSVSLVDVVGAVPEVRGEVTVQCSAHGSTAGATYDGTTVHWDEPHRRVAAGQSVVLYQDDLVAAGGLAT